MPVGTLIWAIQPKSIYSEATETHALTKVPSLPALPPSPGAPLSAHHSYCITLLQSAGMDVLSGKYDLLFM